MRPRPLPLARRQRKQFDFLWPFLLIILGGVIGVLLIQLLLNWLDQRNAELKNKVYVYLDQGEGEILPWGETEWTKVYNGQIVLEGDRLELDPASRGVLEFYNGTVMRLDANTQVALDRIESEDEEDFIEVRLISGHAWIHLAPSDAKNLKFLVNTDHLKVTSYGTIFEVGMTDRETVRVLQDQVRVDVVDRSEDREVAVENVNVGVGQQIELTPSDIKILLARQPLYMLEAVDDLWKQSEWFAWNRSEDENPVAYGLRSQDEAQVSEVTVDPTASAESPEVKEEAPSDSSDDQKVDSTPPVLKVTTPDQSPYSLPVGETSIAIGGTATENTAKITVTSYDVSGAAYPYVLRNYTSESASWKYNASPAYLNLREGRNLFTIVAENKDGFKSAAVEVVIQVSEGAFAKEENEEELSTSTEKTETVSDGAQTSASADATSPEVQNQAENVEPVEVEN